MSAPERARRSRTPLVVAAVVAAVAAAAVYVSRTQPPVPEEPVVAMFAFGTHATVRVRDGRWTYATTLRVVGTRAATIEEVVPIGRGARPVERAYVVVEGSPVPPSSDGSYAPAQLSLDARPGAVLDVVLTGVPDCAAPDRVIGIRVLVRTRGVGEDTYLVTPPRAADPKDELPRLGERACGR